MNLEILKIASNTDNHKVLNNHTHHSKLKNRICGDEMQVSLKVVKNNIVDFGYQCKSCIYCQASVSLLSRNLINKKILNVKNLLKISETFFEKKIQPSQKSGLHSIKYLINKTFLEKNACCYLLKLSQKH